MCCTVPHAHLSKWFGVMSQPTKFSMGCLVLGKRNEAGSDEVKNIGGSKATLAERWQVFTALLCPAPTLPLVIWFIWAARSLLSFSDSRHKKNQIAANIISVGKSSHVHTHTGAHTHIPPHHPPTHRVISADPWDKIMKTLQTQKKKMCSEFYHTLGKGVSSPSKLS